MLEAIPTVIRLDLIKDSSQRIDYEELKILIEQAVVDLGLEVGDLEIDGEEDL